MRILIGGKSYPWKNNGKDKELIVKNTIVHGKKNMVLVLQIMNYGKKTHLKNKFSINSSKHK